MLAKALMNTLRNIHEVAWSCLVNEQLTENACEHKKMTVQMKGMQKNPVPFLQNMGHRFRAIRCVWRLQKSYNILS